MQSFVEHGADPTVQMKDGWSPLHLASQNGHVEIAQFLAAAQKKVGGLRGIWRRTKDMWKSRGPLSSRE